MLEPFALPQQYSLGTWMLGNVQPLPRLTLLHKTIINICMRKVINVPSF